LKQTNRLGTERLQNTKNNITIHYNKSIGKTIPTFTN